MLKPAVLSVTAALALLSAQANSNDVAGYSLDHIGSDQGLPQSSVRAIAQDALGYLWVGTESGMHRYDGVRFELLEPPFGHGVVNSIAIDTRGRVWTSWFTRPTTVYDPHLRQWTTLDIVPPRTMPLGFLEDPEGQIWLSDGSTLYAFSEGTGAASPILEFADATDNVTSVDMVWDEGVIWFPGAGGLVGYDSRTPKMIGAPLQAPRPAIELLGGDGAVYSCHPHRIFKKRQGGQFELHFENPREEITSCALASNGALWLALADTGVLRIDTAGSRQHYSLGSGDPSASPTHRVDKILTDRSGHVWLVSADRLSLLADDKMVHFDYNPGGSGIDYASLLDPQILEDRSGVIWLGTTSDGLARLSRHSRKFSSIAPPGENIRLEQSALDEANNLWVGTRHDGLFRWDRTTETWYHYPPDIDLVSELPSMRVRAILATTTGQVYAGSDVGILSQYAHATDSWQRIQLGGDGPIYDLDELPDNSIVAGRDGQLSFYDTGSDAVSHINLGSNASARVILPSTGGQVWVGSFGGRGLLQVDTDSGTVRSWPEMFAGTNVTSLYEDRHGVLWVGTWGKGLVRFDPLAETVRAFSLDGNLMDHTISAVLPGARDELWIGSENGLRRLRVCESTDPICTPLVTEYDVTDGLANRWYAANSHSAGSSGELFFGGSKTIDFFHASLFEENRVAPIISIIDVRLNGRPLMGADNTDSRFSLAHEFGELDVVFAVTDFHDPAKNTYRYRLNDQAEWVTLGNVNKMTLRNLQAGTHTLEIDGSNNDGVWSLKPIRLSISVASPPYSSWPAILVYCLLAAVLVLAVNRFRERRNQAYTLLLEQEVEKRTDDLRLANQAMADFYANVSHEVRTPLALIVNAAEQLQHTDRPDALGGAVSAIQRHTRSLGRYVDSLITISQLTHASENQWRAEDAVAHVSQLLADLSLLAGNRRLEMQPPSDDELMVRAQAGALNTIFSNLIVNAIKHTQNDGEIRITLEREQSFAKITIHDDGPGIAPEIREQVFDRGALYSAVSGYGIGLHLVRQAAIALGGNATVGASDLGGACFEVTIPLAGDSLPVARDLIARNPLELSISASPHPDDNLIGNGTNPTILVVEDNDELRQGMCEFLSAHYNVLQSATIDGSLDIAIAEIPDVVLCDILLPDGSGFDLVSQIKNDPITNHVPVVVITALADERNRMKGLEYRADAYLTKPVSRRVLATTLENLIRDRRNILRHAAIQIWNENQSESSIGRGPEQVFTRRFMAALQSCYSDSACDVDKLAAELAMSRRALERKTRQFLDRSPNELLTEFRLQHAARLVLDGMRIVDVSLACGFSNPSHFGAVFKKHFGYTPKEYSRENTND